MVEEQKAEAMLRMKQLTRKYNLNPNLSKYLEEGRVYYSYMVSGLFACVDTITYDQSYFELVQKFEREHNAFVYHAIESDTIFGKILSLLYVSVNKDDWQFERPKSDYIASYAYNFSEKLGEFGDIFINSDNGALIRTDV